MDDILQIVCVGLIKAIDNFDFKYNVRFSTYAVPMIAGEIRRYLRDNSVLRISRSLKDIAFKAMKLRELSDNQNITNEEISALLNVKKEDVDAAFAAIIEPSSLYETVYNDSGNSVVLLDQITDERNQEENWLTDIALSEAIKRLNNKEKDIIKIRYYEGKTQIEVGAEIGISQA